MIKFNDDQKKALSLINEFLLSKESKVFFLRGYAGTGKTTIIKEIVDKSIEYRFILLASTGIAAKVMEMKTGLKASTVHSLIYQYSATEKKDDIYVDRFDVKQNLEYNIYIVDEASMIGDEKSTQSNNLEFGSQKLLHDFFESINISTSYSKVIFVGDPLQLPPIDCEDEIPPALNPDYLKSNFKLNTRLVTLTKVERQSAQDGILTNATNIRNAINEKKYDNFKIDRAFDNINDISYEEMIENYIRDMSRTMIITRSNMKALLYSEDIRKRLGFSNILEKSDRLLVLKNNQQYNLMNGEIIELLTINQKIDRKKVNDIYLDFVDITFIRNNKEEKAKVFLNFLNDKEFPKNKIRVENTLLDLVKKEANLIKISDKAKKDSIYYNALQVRYAYSLTCHKAQGGEAEKVIIDNPYASSLFELKWLYTAITRAKNEILILGNRNSYKNIDVLGREEMKNSKSYFEISTTNYKTKIIQPEDIGEMHIAKKFFVERFSYSNTLTRMNSNEMPTNKYIPEWPKVINIKGDGK